MYIPNHTTATRKDILFLSKNSVERRTPYHRCGQRSIGRRADWNLQDLCSPTAGVIDKTNFPDSRSIQPPGLRFQVTLLLLVRWDRRCFHWSRSGSGLTNKGFRQSCKPFRCRNLREELVRIDHNINDNYRLTFRYIHDSWAGATENALWGNGSSFEDINTEFVGLAPALWPGERQHHANFVERICG